MPELPEVESIRQYLSPKIIGKTIKKIIVLEKKQFIGEPKKIINKKISYIQRKGKVMSFEFSKNLYLNCHLKLTGQLLFSEKFEDSVFKDKIPFTHGYKMPGKTTRIIIKFTDGSVLFFNDLRKFGWLKVSDKPETPKSLDILDKNFTLRYFQNALLSSKKPIKILLLDQNKMAGIGNIYANDALFLSKIHPLKKSKTLNEKEMKNLYNAVVQVIKEGIKHKGSSGADEAFILPDGARGGQQNFFKVYQRENKPCQRCKTPIKRIKHAGRSSFFCPNCQRL